MRLRTSRRRFADRIEAREEVTFDPASAALRGRRTRRLGAIVLAEQPFAVEPGAGRGAEPSPTALLRLGLDKLPWSNSLRQWRDRVMFLRAAEGEDWPDLSDPALAASASEWLTPALADKTALAQLTATN